MFANKSANVTFIIHPGAKMENHQNAMCSYRFPSAFMSPLLKASGCKGMKMTRCLLSLSRKIIHCSGHVETKSFFFV